MSERKPVEILEFSDDLHSADTEPLRDFLRARLSELAEQQEEGSGAAWAVHRLRQSTDRIAVCLSDLLTGWGMEVAEGRTDEPGLTQRLRQDVQMWWNELCLTAAQFSDHPDHLPRWRTLEHLCLEFAEWHEHWNDGFSSGTYQDGAHP
ncbi:hypothetical protein [Streptomyces sp. NBC_00083]|uniref:hypothetical protein n=1 Tax=Streptomyces sp. NBC_00083 TaxID=2975647 RepID=UPI002259DF5E|nr:hypothetical protein [Streptomyces sp. NBC_00083]MCX5384586.1 hypothetical protein [Streptomyces sp. NBC_00083]